MQGVRRKLTGGANDNLATIRDGMGGQQNNPQIALASSA
jgi:hypothetical protein